jgi:iron complex outermembrane receptor protein
MNHLRTRLGLLGGVVGYLSIQMLAPAAMAESAATTGAGEDQSLQLEEIVITAQKREENLQKADVAVTAITGDTLSKMNITSALDLTEVVPNLAIGQTGTGARVSMRGVVTNNDFEGGNPDVAFNINGVYLGRQRAALTSFFDVDRVEVLRGPQGTLYGRNAAAGSINVITALPDLSHEFASGSLGFGDYNATDAFGMLNLPLSDTFGIRGAYQAVRHAGYVKSAPSNQDYDDQDTVAGRVSLLWKPSEDFTSSLVYEQSHNGGTGAGGVNAGGPLGEYMTSSGSSPYRWFVRPVDSFTNETIKSTTLNADWNTSVVDVTYLGNYRTDNWFTIGGQSANGPISSTCQVAVAIPVSDATNCTSVVAKSLDRQYSHELRFSKNTDKFKSVFGLYYYKEDNNVFTGLDPAPGGPPPAGPAYTRTFAFVFPDVEEDSKAAFAQATYSFTDQFRLTGGARYTKDHKYRAGNFYLAAAGGSIVDFQCVNCAATAFAVIPSYADLSWNKVTWKVAADYDLAPESMLFGAVSTGYKEGGYGDGTPPNNSPFNAEDLINYELGWKSNFFDRRLQLNIDAFHTLFTNYQATSGTTNPDGSIAAVTVNAGKAQIDGIELESTTLITAADKVAINATWLDARFTDFVLPFGDPYGVVNGNVGPCPTCGYSLTGAKLPYAPNFTVRVDWQHTFTLPNGAALVSRLDSEYVASQELEYHNYASTHQPSYTRSGFSLSYEPSKVWTIMAYVRNIENKAVLVKADLDNNAPNADFNNFAKQGYWMPPRTFGAKISANF